MSKNKVKKSVSKVMTNKQLPATKTKFVKYNEKDLPNDLKVNPFFLNVLSLDAKDMFEFNVDALKSFGYETVEFYWHPEEGYIFAKGTLPVCLCAHMDKVPYYKSIKSIKKINKVILLDKKDRPSDVLLNSKQGIGGDDRCGIYAILQMLKLGHRPSVLFCMGEEIGCRGSCKFTLDHAKDFLSDINAFIQIDRRGSHDCVRYSDNNDALTKAIEQFDFKHAWGSCTDISVLMPHFGISGVNLSSGYYHEHSGETEYVSVKDVNHLLVRLNKILKSDIFTEKYEYKTYTPHYYSSYDRSSYFAEGSYKQMSLFDDMPYIEDQYGICDVCGQYCEHHELVEVYECGYAEIVCPSCARDLLKQGFVRCPSCNNLSPKKDKGDPRFVHNYCPYCGYLLDDDD